MPVPSVERTALGAGLRHFLLSLLAFGGLSGAAAAGAFIFGNEEASGPRVELALFAISDGPPPTLKTRIENQGAGDLGHMPLDEPSLPGVEYDEGLGTHGAQGGASFKVIEVSEVLDGNLEGKTHAALAKAPITGFNEHTPAGNLPKIATNGRTPAQAYARPFKIDPALPRVSLVVAGLGLKDQYTKAAITELPPEVTLSFVPYVKDLQRYIDLAREHGHEVLLELPMEAYDYPNVDTGPQTLLTSKPSDENVRRLSIVMGRATGYFGLTNYQGAKFATSSEAAQPIFAELHSRGLAFLHDGAAARSSLPDAAKQTNLKFRVADRIVDTEPSADAIDRELLQIEALAIQNGQAIGVGYAYPVTIEQFRIWTQSLKTKGYQLTPVSANMGIQTQ